MKKKLIVVITAMALVLGIGTVALANSDSEVFENFNFQEMLPFMQEMHPDFDEEQLEEMYESCHGEGGIMNGQRGRNIQGNQIPAEMQNFMNNQGGSRF